MEEMLSRIENTHLEKLIFIIIVQSVLVVQWGAFPLGKD
jgi:hypothetical protein